MDAGYQTALETDGPDTTEIMTTTAPSGLPLDTLGRMISAALTKSDNYRITAARYLLEARERVESGEAGDIKWKAWCAENVKRSYRDVQRFLALAKADDPEAALVKSKESAAAAMRKSRRKAKVMATNVSRPPAPSNLDVPGLPEGKSSADVDIKPTTAVSGEIVGASIGVAQPPHSVPQPEAHLTTAPPDVKTNVEQQPPPPLPLEVVDALAKTSIGTPTPELQAKLEHIRKESHRLMTGSAAMREAMLEAVAAAAITLSGSIAVADLVTQFNELPTAEDRAAFHKAIAMNGDTWWERVTNVFNEGSPRERDDFILSRSNHRKRRRSTRKSSQQGRGTERQARANGRL